jgi:hypothetical protein
VIRQLIILMAFLLPVSSYAGVIWTGSGFIGETASESCQNWLNAQAYCSATTCSITGIDYSMIGADGQPTKAVCHSQRSTATATYPNPDFQTFRSGSCPAAGTVYGYNFPQSGLGSAGSCIGGCVTNWEQTGVDGSGEPIGTVAYTGLVCMDPYDTTSSGGSTSTGDGSTSTGDGSTSTGDGSTSTGDGSTSTGDGSTSTGDGSTSTGDGSTSTGDGSTSTGDGSTSTGDGSTSTGDGSTSTGDGSTSTGDGSTSTTTSTTSSTSTGDGSTSTGDGSTGSGDGSTGSGDGSTGSGDGSTGSGDGSGSGSGGSGQGDGSGQGGTDDDGEGNATSGAKEAFKDRFQYPEIKADNFYKREKKPIKEIWDENKDEFEQTALLQALESLKFPDGGGSCPSWTISIWNLGDFTLLPECWVFGAIRAIIIVTAIFTARRLIFGG